MPFEIALVSLDLAALHHLFSEWGNAERLALDTLERFQVLAADKEAIAALKIWSEAVKARKLSEAITEKARQVIEAGLSPGR